MSSSGLQCCSASRLYKKSLVVPDTGGRSRKRYARKDVLRRGQFQGRRQGGGRGRRRRRRREAGRRQGEDEGEAGEEQQPLRVAGAGQVLRRAVRAGVQAGEDPAARRLGRRRRPSHGPVRAVGEERVGAHRRQAPARGGGAGCRRRQEEAGQAEQQAGLAVVVGAAHGAFQPQGRPRGGAGEGNRAAGEEEQGRRREVVLGVGKEDGDEAVLLLAAGHDAAAAVPRGVREGVRHLLHLHLVVPLADLERGGSPGRREITGDDGDEGTQGCWRHQGRRQTSGGAA